MQEFVILTLVMLMTLYFPSTVWVGVLKVMLGCFVQVDVKES